MNLFNEPKNRGPITSTTRNFFIRKTIQKAYNFMVRFDLGSVSNFNGELFEHHAVAVEIPNYDFKKEKLEVGPFVKTFPVLDHNGFEFTIKFEEDDQGTISSFVDWLINRNINSDGYYRTHTNTVVSNIVIDVSRDDGMVVCRHWFQNCYFMKQSTINYDFSVNDKITYDITFNADHYWKEYKEAANTPDLFEE